MAHGQWLDKRGAQVQNRCLLRWLKDRPLQGEPDCRIAHGILLAQRKDWHQRLVAPLCKAITAQALQRDGRSRRDVIRAREGLIQRLNLLPTLLEDAQGVPPHQSDKAPAAINRAEVGENAFLIGLAEQPLSLRESRLHHSVHADDLDHRHHIDLHPIDDSAELLLHRYASSVGLKLSHRSQDAVVRGRHCIIDSAQRLADVLHSHLDLRGIIRRDGFAQDIAKVVQCVDESPHHLRRGGCRLVQKVIEQLHHRSGWKVEAGILLRLHHHPESFQISQCGLGLLIILGSRPANQVENLRIRPLFLAVLTQRAKQRHMARAEFEEIGRIDSHSFRSGIVERRLGQIQSYPRVEVMLDLSPKPIPAVDPRTRLARWREHWHLPAL